MRVLAYARRTLNGPSIPDQIAHAEADAAAHGHEVRRLLNVGLTANASEWPPLRLLIDACRRELVHAVVLTSFDVLPRLEETLSALDESGAILLVAGDGNRPALQLRSLELQFAAEVARAACQEQEVRTSKPRRVCPPRVHVDVAVVRELQSRGATLRTISRRMQIAKSTLCRALRKDREREERLAAERRAKNGSAP